MATRLKSVFRRGRLVGAVAASTAFAAGCALFTTGSGEGKSAPGGQPHPMLAAARANSISLFGERGDEAGSGYFTRAAVSLKRHTFAEVGDDSDPNIDPAGRRIVFASTRHNTQPDLYIKAIHGVAVTQLTSDPASDVQPAFSPGGERVAFASSRSGNWDIWVVGVDGGQPVQITDGMADDVHPSWSPDGTQLVYCSLPAEGGQWELWLAEAEAGPTRKFVGYGLFPEWSPAGGTILFQRARERGSRRFSVWTLTLVNGEPRYPTELASGPGHAFILPAWSPDGAYIAFTSAAELPVEDAASAVAGASMDIWLMSADGRGKIRLTDGYTRSYGPAFSRDGRVFFTSRRTGRENIWSLWPSGLAPRAIDEDLEPGGTESVTRAAGLRKEHTAHTLSVKNGL